MIKQCKKMSMPEFVQTKHSSLRPCRVSVVKIRAFTVRNATPICHASNSLASLSLATFSASVLRFFVSMVIVFNHSHHLNSYLHEACEPHTSFFSSRISPLFPLVTSILHYFDQGFLQHHAFGHISTSLFEVADAWALC